MISYANAGLDAVLKKIEELDNGPEVQDDGEIRVETRGDYVIVSWKHMSCGRWVVYVGGDTYTGASWPNGWTGVYDDININYELVNRGFSRTGLQWHYLETSRFIIDHNDESSVATWMRNHSDSVSDEIPVTRDLIVEYTLRRTTK